MNCYGSGHIMNPPGRSRRIFIGIPILEEKCPKFFAWSRNLTQESSLQPWNIRWTKPENYHVTVCFLGESDRHPIDEIIQKLSKEKIPPFWIQIQQLGFFMNGKNSNVMWAGIESPEIHAFRKTIQSLMSSFGYQEDFKSFQPHITLGRIKNPVAAELHQERIATTLDQCKITQFGLYESILSIQNIQYENLATFHCA